MLAKILAVLEEEESWEAFDFVLLADWVVYSTVDFGNFGVCFSGGELFPLLNLLEKSKQMKTDDNR